jgi:hypothetical protein
MTRYASFAAAALLLALTAGAPLRAHAPSGAIFTTVADGSEVNFNQYPSKEAVYLDGGPGPGAPQHAAGLDDGVYVFMVTDPSGKTLLSTDRAECRQFTVAAGIIVSTAPSSCPHVTGTDIDHGATTVQLMPYDDTPNPGGVYKVWVTRVEDYVCPLQKVDCRDRGSKHGFVPAHSKTDNFKVRDVPIVEIDTRFFNDVNQNGWREWEEPYMDGYGVMWTDPLGASNAKWSYFDAAIDVNHEAHVEAVEAGTHFISIADQAGCRVGTVYVDGAPLVTEGPQTVAVEITQQHIQSGATIFVDIACQPN